MDLTKYIDGLSLWWIFLASVVIILLSNEVGFQLGSKRRRLLAAEEKIQTGPVVAACLGLLAFILAFTFGSVTSGYDERKQLVLSEAIVIGTAYLRVDLLPQADRTKIRRILYDYVTLRIDAMKSGNVQQIQQGIDRSKELQGELWSRAVAIAAQNQTPVSALFLQSVNELIDLHQRRVTVGLDLRMPTIFWVALYSLTVLAMLAGGYDAGLIGRRRSITTLIAEALAFSVVLLLVVALDRPLHQLSIVSQAALLELQQDIQRSLRAQ